MAHVKCCCWVTAASISPERNGRHSFASRPKIGLEGAASAVIDRSRQERAVVVDVRSRHLLVREMAFREGVYHGDVDKLINATRTSYDGKEGIRARLEKRDAGFQRGMSHGSSYDEALAPLTTEQAKRLSGNLGVYQLANDAGEVLYIGAATGLSQLWLARRSHGQSRCAANRCHAVPCRSQHRLPHPPRRIAGGPHVRSRHLADRQHRCRCIAFGAAESGVMPVRFVLAAVPPPSPNLTPAVGGEELGRKRRHAFASPSNGVRYRLRGVLQRRETAARKKEKSDGF